MKKLSIATSAFAAALLVACNPGAETTEKEAVQTSEVDKAEQQNAADGEAADRLVNACMSKSYDDLNPKLKYTDEAPQDFKDYYQSKAERCVKGNTVQFFALTYDRKVLDDLSDKVATAEITALETKADPKYPTRAQVKSTMTAHRR